MENNNLKKYIDNFFNDIELYDDYRNGHNYKGLLKSSIDMFLDYSSVFNAIRVYEMFFGIYQITSEDKSSAGRYGDNNIEPNIILDIIELFLKYENKVNINFSVPIHSVNVFIMGLAIYSQNNSYRDVFKEYVLSSPYEKYYKDMDNEFSNEEFLYRWGITSLLFDLAMPVELLSKPLKKRMTDEINSVFENYDELNHINLADLDESNFIPKINYDFADNYRLHYYNSKFLDLFKPTEVMAHRISENFRFNNEQMRLLTNHLDNFVDYMEENEFIDHGFVSSVLTLNFYGYLIQKYRKNHDFFFYPVVDSASAILLHNYYRNILQRNPFNLGSLFVRYHPLAFLLILCDEIQQDNGEATNSFVKSHISNIEISDKELDVEYMKNVGFNHLKYKEEFIYYTLDVEETCFLRGIRIFDRYSVEKDENNLRDILKSEIQPANTSIRTVEKLANQLHQSYIDSVTAQYEEEKSKGEVNEWTKQRYEWLTPFEELSSQLIMSNIRQAESIPKKLNFIGCEIAELSDEREAITNFSDDETLDLAICEHEQWCEEKISQGWTYGEVRDNDNLIHDCLVPWDELSPELQQYDIDLVKEIPSLVESCGFKIVKNKISLLCLEIIKYQGDEFSLLQTGDFSGNNRYINFIQTNNLIKTLSKRGYFIKDCSDDCILLVEFGEDEIDYIACRQHEVWCKIKFSLGWNYDFKNDNEEKTSPYLVDWYDLDKSTQNLYINIIRNLPEICNEVGLKIIKN